MARGNKGSTKGCTYQSESSTAKGITRGCALAQHKKCDGVFSTGVIVSGALAFHKCECSCHAG